MPSRTPNQSLSAAPEVPQAQVDQQLRRMLGSPIFQRAARPARFLEVVVRRLETNPGEPSSEAEIADAVFGRSDFDPRLDPIVRVEAARLRKRIEEYYADSGKNDSVRITLPRRGYVPTVSIQSAGNSAVSMQATEAHGMRLAVLPFANLSGDETLNAFCLGLTEEVIAAVTDLSGILVVSRTSASQYEGESVDVRAVGRALGVSHVLEGSVRKGETVIRATAKLVDCASGFTSWSKTLEINADGDPVMLQASLGWLIAETVDAKLHEGQDDAAGNTPTASK